MTWRARTVPVDAWAVDPDCACYGIEGEVDRHFLSRVVLPAAARFAEGFLTAIAMPARTLTVDDGAVFHERAQAGTEEALYGGRRGGDAHPRRRAHGRRAEGDHGAHSAQHAARRDDGSPIARIVRRSGVRSGFGGREQCRAVTWAMR